MFYEWFLSPLGYYSVLSRIVIFGTYFLISDGQNKERVLLPNISSLRAYLCKRYSNTRNVRDVSFGRQKLTCMRAVIVPHGSH